KNTYLAGIESKAYKNGGLWPTDAEVDAMAPHFEKLLDAYRKEAHGLEEPVKYSAFERQAYIDRLTATLMGMTPEQYAASRPERYAAICDAAIVERYRMAAP